MLAIVLWMSLLPLATNFMMEQLPTQVDPKDIPKSFVDDGKSEDGKVQY